VFAASIAVAAGACAFVIEVYLPGFSTTQTDLTGVAHPPSPLPPTPGLARRIVVVVVDGLKFDAARDLPEFASLRRAGVVRPLMAERPTYTGPSVTAMITGLDPVDSGVRRNGLQRGVPGLDSVTEELAAAKVAIEVDPEEFSPFAHLLRAPADAKV